MPMTTSNPINTPAQFVKGLTPIDTTEYTATTNAYNLKKSWTFTLPARSVITGWYIEGEVKGTGGAAYRVDLKLNGAGSYYTMVSGSSGTYTAANKTFLDGSGGTMRMFDAANYTTIAVEVYLACTNATGTAYLKDIKVGMFYYSTMNLENDSHYA